MISKGNNKKYGIVIAILCSLTAGFSIPVNMSGVFLSPVAMELGFKQGDFSFHTTLTLFISAIVSLYVPRLMAKVHFKYILLSAALITGASNIMMGFSGQLWQFNVWGIARGVGAGLISMVPIAIIINNWFHKNHGMITSLVLSFSSVSGALLTPLFANLIERIGWQNSYVVSGVLIILLLLPGVIFPFADNPQQDGLLPFGAETVGEEHANDGAVLLDNRPYDSFILAAIVLVAVGHTAVIGIIQHFPGLSVESGYGAGIGAIMLSAAMVGSVVFKMLIGALCDRLNAITANMIMVLIHSIAVLIMLSTPNPLIIVLGAFLYGSAYSIPAVGVTLISKELLGNYHFNRFFPLISFGVATSAAASISLIGYLFDYTGSYVPALVLTMIVNVINITFLVMMSRKLKKDSWIEVKS